MAGGAMDLEQRVRVRQRQAGLVPSKSLSSTSRSASYLSPMLGSRFAALVLAGCLGCGSAGTRADHPAPDREQSAPRAPSARARAQFGKAFTGQARPTIVV